MREERYERNSTVFSGRISFSFIRASLIKYQEYFLKKYAAKVKNEIRSQILDKIMVLGPSFKNDQRTGNLQSLITDGVESLEAFLTQYIPQIAVVVLPQYLLHLLCAAWIGQ